jgi:dienelactone hydrolase
MRSRCWCSALAVVALAGCGSSGGGKDAAPYSYAADAPLDARVGPSLTPPGNAVGLFDFSFRGANGRRLSAYLLEPRPRARRPAVVLLHGSGGTRADMLVPAGQLAQRGAIALTVSMPNDVASYRPLVVDARRALDALVARREVDPKRIAVIGYSLGAQTAAILTGVDRRPSAVAIMAGRGTTRTKQFIRRSRARLFFVGGTRDVRAQPAEVRALAAVAPGHPRVHWYPVDHSLSLTANNDVVAWVAKALRLDR